MKYLFLPLILILTSCSFDKNSTYWNENQKIKSLENKQLSKILKKNSDLKKMTFKEFNLFLEDYSKKAEYPDINK